MNPSADANDERFDQVESVLNQLANSQRHLLHAQVLMNDRLTRTESLVEQLAEHVAKLAGTVGNFGEKVDKLAEQVQIIADGQKHSDARIDALTDMVRHLIERNGEHLQ